VRFRVRVRAGLHVRRETGSRHQARVIGVGAGDWLRRIESDRARYVRFARGRVASDADADDVVQRALLLAVARGATLSDEERAEAWFFRVLRRSIADHHRAQSQSSVREEVGADVEAIAAPEPPARGCCCGDVLLAEVPTGYAEILRRVDAGDESVDAVASSLGISANNAYVRLHRARRALRARVEERCGVRNAREALACECGACE
jgi:DNA-directed RNA polymerase specialized sigma24 family protein